MFLDFNNLTLLLLLQGNLINPTLKEGAEKTHLQGVPSASVNRCTYCNKACGRLVVTNAPSNTEMRSWSKSLSLAVPTYDQQALYRN